MTTAAPPPAAYRRRTSTYVLAFDRFTCCAEDTLADLLAACAVRRLTVYGSGWTAGEPVTLNLRLSDDGAAVEAARTLAADVQSGVAGVVTGLGVHRREVAL
jgi:hypothetical protein